MLARLRSLAETEDGFELAEMDLAARGPGELLGKRQSGEPELCLANPIGDGGLLEDCNRRMRAGFDVLWEEEALREAVRRAFGEDTLGAS